MIGTVRTSIRVVKKFLEAPEQLDALFNDLTDARLLVKIVESTLKSHQQKTLPKELCEQVCIKLEDARQQLYQLSSLVQQVHPNVDHGARIKQSAHWILAKGKIERMKSKFESVCETLRLSLGDYKM